jgi:type I restriction enzyme S subunit
MKHDQVRLKYLAQIPITNGLGLSGAFDEPSWPRYIRTTDIRDERSLREDVFASQPPDVAAPAMVQAGDILMTAAGTIGKSYLHGEAAPSCYAGYLVRFRPIPGVDSRYISYWMQSADYWAQIESGAVRSTIDNFSAGRYRDMRVPLRPQEEQRRIADFLDDQVTRIDALIEARGLQLRLLRERMQSGYDAIFTGPAQPLKRLLRQSPCYGVLVPQFVDAGGVPFIRVSDLEALARGPLPLRQIDRSQSLEYRRTMVSAGDVLLGVVGSMDKSAVVGAEHVGANVARAVARLLPAPGIPSLALWAWTRTTAYSDQARLATGSDTAQPTLNMGDLKNFTVAWPDRTSSAELEAQVQGLVESADRAECAFLKSTGLLVERKRALITAAVTGEFDVSTAGPRAAAAVTV